MTPFPFPSPDAVFAAANALAMLGWIALAVSPARVRWAGAARRFAGRIVPLLLAVGYVVLFVRNGMVDGGYGSLAEVWRLFAVPELLAAGWLHYLAFDLFVGAWIAERSEALSLPHLALLPVLLLTFLFGPAGLLAFVTLRAVVQWWRRRGVDAAAAAT
jgi:hypothetical protein